MVIFLRHIPAYAQKHEIASLIEPLFNDYRTEQACSEACLHDIEFMSLRDIRSDAPERHALVTITPHGAARYVLKHIDGAILKDTPLSAREYVTRSLVNDPRNETEAASEAAERRISERRRKPLLNAWQQNPVLVYSL